MTETRPNERLARLVVPSAVAVVTLHLVVWIAEGARSGRGLGGVLGNWDSEFYSEIASRGYSGRLYAFFPLFPKTEGVLARLTGTLAEPQWMGGLLSLACFAGFVALMVSVLRRGESWRGVVPATSTGWLVFLLSPATYTFHYNGTEGMFLLWSFAAVVAAHRDRWLLAALLAGLAALTRNQGVFVAIAVALEAGHHVQAPSWKRLGRVAASGAISGALFALYPIWLYRSTGDALTFMHVQSIWRKADGIGGALATLWFGNPWQNHGFFSILHHVLFFLLIGAGVSLVARRPRDWPLALYVLVSVLILIFQGELANMFRFGAVLFPALFVLGDAADRWPRPARVGLVAGMLLLNLVWAWKHAAGYWAG